MPGFFSHCKQSEKTSHLIGDCGHGLAEKVFVAPIERIHYDFFAEIRKITRVSSINGFQVEVMPFFKSHPDNLLSLWGGECLFADKDGDGYPDHVGTTIVVSPDVKDSHVWAGVLNLVA